MKFQLALPLILVSMLLTLIHPIGASAANSCIEVLLSHPKQGWNWNDPTTARIRYEAVVKHQNQLRHAMGVPLLHLPKEDISGLRIEGTNIVEIPMNERVDEAFGYFSIKGEDLIRDSYNDLFGLNFVYRFDGAKLVEVIPYLNWKLNQVDGPEVVLYRAMGDNELTLWRNGSFSSLGRIWGHRTSHSPEEPIIHFSTDSKLTSAGRSAIKVRVPKELLLSWAKKTGRLWSAQISRDDDPINVSEIVLPTELLLQLAHKGYLQIEFLR